MPAAQMPCCRYHLAGWNAQLAVHHDGVAGRISWSGAAKCRGRHLGVRRRPAGRMASAASRRGPSGERCNGWPGRWRNDVLAADAVVAQLCDAPGARRSAADPAEHLAAVSSLPTARWAGKEDGAGDTGATATRHIFSGWNASRPARQSQPSAQPSRRDFSSSRESRSQVNNRLAGHDRQNHHNQI